MMQTTTTTHPIATALRIMTLLIAGGVILWLVSNVLLLALFATLFAVLLRRISVWLARLFHVPPLIMLLLSVLLLLVAVAGVIYLAGPSFVAQSEQLYGTVIAQGEALEHRFGNSPVLHWLIAHVSSAGSTGHPALMVAGSTFELVANAVVVVITALYFASSPALYVNGMVRLLPLGYRPRGRQILERIGQTLWWWLVGQGVDMLVVGTLATVGFLIVGVPLPFLLGGITGGLSFIPYFGPFLSAVPAGLAGLTVSPMTAVNALGVLLACHLVEGYIVAPLVQRRLVELPPALTILSLLLFATLFGTLGAVLATPLLAAVLVVVQQGYVADVLGDTKMRDEGAPANSSGRPVRLSGTEERP